jgi:hypothetical protein
LRFVLANSLSCFSDIDFSICFEAPLRLDFGRFPRFAANATPAAICCFFDLAGILLFRWPLWLWLGDGAKPKAYWGRPPPPKEPPKLGSPIASYLSATSNRCGSVELRL